MFKAKTFLIASAKELKSKLTSGFLAFVLIVLSCLLTLPVFAQLAIDNHPSEEDAWGNAKINVYVSASIDSLYYDGMKPGVAYVSGTLEMVNYDDEESYSWNGDLRLDVLPSGDDPNQGAPCCDEKEPFSGTLNPGDVFSTTYYASVHVDRTGTQRGQWWRLKGTITVYLPEDQQWQADYDDVTFFHDPGGSVGIGPMTNGDFSEDFTGDVGDSWDSLMITDAPYDEIWWYVKPPWDTSYYGTDEEIDEGNGEDRRATMTYTFPAYPEDYDGNNRYFTITAYVYRWDGSVYEKHYDVLVNP